MTNPFISCMLRENKTFKCCCVWETGAGENRKSGVNPERYRHCMRRGYTRDESRSLGKPEKAGVWLGKRKSGDLLKWNALYPACIGKQTDFCWQKNGCRNQFWLRQLFYGSDGSSPCHTGQRSGRLPNGRFLKSFGYRTDCVRYPKLLFFVWQMEKAYLRQHPNGYCQRYLLSIDIS